MGQQRYREDQSGQERRRGEWERSQGGSDGDRWRPGEYGGAAHRGYGSESDWTSERRGEHRSGYGRQSGYGARDREFDEARGDWGPAGRGGEDDLGARREDYGRWGREELYPGGGPGGRSGEWGGTRRGYGQERWGGFQPGGGYRDDGPGQGGSLSGGYDPWGAGVGQRYRQGGGYGVQQRRTHRGPKGYKRSDERLKEDISERLMNMDVDASEVSVEVQSGKVTLEGTVSERWMKHTIEDVADACPGVQDVDNRIRVQLDEGSRTQEPGTQGAGAASFASGSTTRSRKE
jgi:hypothetical protein